jgi:hypothetical protein
MQVRARAARELIAAGELEEQGLAQFTVLNVLTALSGIYSWALRRGKVGLKPCPRLGAWRAADSVRPGEANPQPG